VAFCSYRFANLLMQDPAFMKYGNQSQEMTVKGILGEVDGVKIVKVPSARLPLGAAYILAHPSATTAPKQLEDFKIHDNPPGINGWLVEGRVIYDCFILNNKNEGIYYLGSQAVLSDLIVNTAATATNKSTVLVLTDVPTGYSLYYKVGTAAETVAYDNIVSTSTSGSASNTIYGWTALTNASELTKASTETEITVVMVETSSMKAKAVGSTELNFG